MKKQLGILGGSFNPIHLGHLRGAEEIRQRFGLEKILFIPTYIPPHKPMDTVIDYSHRKYMTQLAISNNPYFVLEDIEEHLPAPSYSFRTIQALIEKYGQSTDFSFILGEDDFSNIHTWHSPSMIFSLCTVIVITRHSISKKLPQLLPVDLKDDFWYSEKEEVLIHKSGKKVYLSAIPVLDISASRIRLAVKNGLSVRYLIPDSVIEYIEKEKLYY
ncbi:MAG: nicotinate (nicotinamide) nucleotide adenylyltransferase [bacterium]